MRWLGRTQSFPSAFCACVCSAAERLASVRFALERCQIVKARRDLRAGFFLFGNIRDWISLARCDNGFRRRMLPNPIGAMVLVAIFLEIRALICAFVSALCDFELDRDAPIVARLEITNLQLTLVNDRERRRLHAAD